uniref:Inka box actin regulator 2 n=1 Tax=Tetraodon nigroviridis TaxID=99883 RepID=H3CNK6_TETNG
MARPECRNMDACLRRLKQELVSMKEAGDGLHAQMNSMMGALQELKLLQVQTALENLDITGRPINRGLPRPAPAAPLQAGATAAMAPVVGSPPPEPSSHPQAPHRARVVDLPGILYSLSREGPSLDNECSQESVEDGSDWTSSLMSSSRNRQPLVLGDNVFADLVGNWLDLPSHPLRLSRSQEICRKFSLTTNIFKKFLRSVRPDRDKLLKERPGWAAPELPEGDLFKRPKKAAPKCSKGSFYLPFWANGQQGKDRRQADAVVEKMPPLFDYNTAVWV